MDEQLLNEHLDVYDTKDGPWNPDHGELEIPPGWELLPSGDSFVTRTVKAMGRYWVAWNPRTRSRPHRRLIGVWAPTATIATARAKAAETAANRERKRAQGAVQRARQEDRYRQELADAIVAFLDFSPEHDDLARKIAIEAASRAGEVGSGRVGRTRTLSVTERAALAARACIRHRFTGYETDLEQVWDDDFLYREIKTTAQVSVDAFLADHRSRD